MQYQAPNFTITHYEQRGRIGTNGLRYVVMPDPGALQLEVALRYDVGSSDDPDGKAGLAHLVEHLMFDIKPNGDTHSMQYYIEHIASLYNAFTNYDETEYWLITRPNMLGSVLQLESIRMREGCASITEDNFEREREVVRNEIRQRSGTPEGQIDRILAQQLFPAGHPYARTVGGDDAQIAALTLQDACDFMERYYTPERATLIVAGHAPGDTAVAAIQKWFGSLPPKSAAARRPVVPVDVQHQRQTVDLDIDRPILAVSWALPPIKTIADDHALDEYFERIRGLGRAGAVYEFATRIAPTMIGGRGAPMLTFIIELDDLANVDKAIDFVWKSVGERASVVDHPADEARRNQTELVVELEPLTTRVDHIADLVQLAPADFTGPGALLFHELDTYKTQDLHAVDDLVHRELTPERAHITIFRPSKAGIKGDARAAFAFQPAENLSQPDASDAEEAESALDVTKDHDALAGATRYQLANGMRIVLMPVKSTLPVVTAKLVFDSGNATTPDQPLLAEATAQFAIPAPAFLYRLGMEGIQTTCSATLDNTSCTARTIGVYAHDAIEGLERRIKDPLFDQKSIESWQRQVAQRGERRHRAAADEVERQLLGALYGPDHPYTKARTGALGAERSVSRDALFAYRDAHFHASNATLIVAGTFEPDEAKTTIEKTFGGWERGTPTPAVPPAAQRTTPAFVGVIRDAGPQLDVSIAYAAPGGIGADQATRLVLEQMIGDAETAVRGRLGATYGTHAFRDQRRGPTRYEVRAAVDAARAGEAVAAMRAAIDDLRHGTDFAEHFARARRTVAHHLMDESSMSNAIATQLATLAEFDQPPTYFSQLLLEVGAIMPADVSKLLASELPAEHEVVVLAADRDTLIKTFEASGIRDYKLVEPSEH